MRRVQPAVLIGWRLEQQTGRAAAHGAAVRLAPRRRAHPHHQIAALAFCDGESGVDLLAKVEDGVADASCPLVVCTRRARRALLVAVEAEFALPAAGIGHDASSIRAQLELNSSSMSGAIWAPPHTQLPPPQTSSRCWRSA